MSLKLFPFVGLVFYSSVIFAGSLSEQILANQEFCVACKKNEKIYFNSKVVYPTKEGIYIALNENEYILTPFIQLDRDGYYLKCKDKKSKKGSGKKKSKQAPPPPLWETFESGVTPNIEESIVAEDEIAEISPPVIEEVPNYIEESNPQQKYKTGIVHFKEDFFSDEEIVWDQDGKVLTKEEIAQLPEIQWEIEPVEEN